MNNSHNERMTKEDALGEALAKAKQMSLTEAKAIYGENFETYKTIKAMRARGWGVQVRRKRRMRSCGFKHEDVGYEVLQ